MLKATSLTAQYYSSFSEISNLEFFKFLKPVEIFNGWANLYDQETRMEIVLVP